MHDSAVNQQAIITPRLPIPVIIIMIMLIIIIIIIGPNNNNVGVTVTNTNDIREGIKRRVNMGNIRYYSLEEILSSAFQEIEN